MIGNPQDTQVHPQQIHHHQRPLQNTACLLIEKRNLQGEGFKEHLRVARRGGDRSHIEAIGRQEHGACEVLQLRGQLQGHRRTPQLHLLRKENANFLHQVTHLILSSFLI